MRGTEATEIPFRWVGAPGLVFFKLSVLSPGTSSRNIANPYPYLRGRGKLARIRR